MGSHFQKCHQKWTKMTFCCLVLKIGFIPLQLSSHCMLNIARWRFMGVWVLIETNMVCPSLACEHHSWTWEGWTILWIYCSQQVNMNSNIAVKFWYYKLKLFIQHRIVIILVLTWVMSIQNETFPWVDASWCLHWESILEGHSHHVLWVNYCNRIGNKTGCDPHEKGPDHQ